MLQLCSVENPAHSVTFSVDLARTAYIGEDLTKIKPFDFPLIVFRFSPPEDNKYKREYFTTQDLYLRLMNTSLLENVLTKEVVQKRQQ